MDESSEQKSQENGEQNRARLVFAAILIAGLAVAGILIPLLASGDDEDAVVPADPECIESWNADELQLQFGIHQFVAHNYSEIQVLRLADDGGPGGRGRDGQLRGPVRRPAAGPGARSRRSDRDQRQMGPGQRAARGDAEAARPASKRSRHRLERDPRRAGATDRAGDGVAT